MLIPPVARDEWALTEFSLVSGGDDIETRQMLDNELDLFMGQPQGEREGGRREDEGGEGENREGGEEGGERRRMKIRQRNVRRVDPGMSVLQDSVLGMPPDGKRILYNTRGEIRRSIMPYFSISRCGGFSGLVWTWNRGFPFDIKFRSGP